MTRFLTIVVAIGALATGACQAAGGMKDSERIALYDAHSGPPVKEFRYFNPIGFEEVADDYIVVRTKPSEEWLLKLSGPCLRWGSGSNAVIGLSSTAGRVMSGFDRVTVAGSPASCRIEQIRQVDIKGLRAARDAMAKT